MKEPEQPPTQMDISRANAWVDFMVKEMGSMTVMARPAARPGIAPRMTPTSMPTKHMIKVEGSNNRARADNTSAIVLCPPYRLISSSVPTGRRSLSI